MLATMSSDRGTATGPREDDTTTAPSVPPLTLERHGYSPAPENRLFALAGTSLIFATVAAGLFLTFEHVAVTAKPSAALVVTLLPLASPPKAPPKPTVAPKPVERQKTKPVQPKVEPIVRPIMSTPVIAAPSRPAVADPAPQAPAQPATAAPTAAPAPPAPQVSSNAPDTWEGRVLARLERFRRYPDAAQRAGQQGVAYIRFRMNRDGHVLSASLEKSSGFPALDQAALETLRRADPLPKIPANRPDEIELSVPVEYFEKARL